MQPSILLFSVPRLLNTVRENKPLCELVPTICTPDGFLAELSNSVFESLVLFSLQFLIYAISKQKWSLYTSYSTTISLIFKQITCLLIQREISRPFCMIFPNFIYPIHKQVILSCFWNNIFFFSHLFPDSPPSMITKSFQVSCFMSNFS